MPYENGIIKKKDFGAFVGVTKAEICGMYMDNNVIEPKNNFDNLNNINYMNQYIQNYGPEYLRKFRVEDYLGKGSESHVYKARFIGSNKNFCLKVIKKNKKYKININELIISKRMKHKNIVNLLCYYTDPNKEYDFILMELGNSNLSHFLWSVLKRNTFSETFLCMIAFQVLEALWHLNMCKIAHLDLKPQNLIINEFLDIKLIDFSVSLDYGKVDKDTIKLPYVGTPSFMSPEIIENKRIRLKDLQKVDLFSLGITLYVLGFGAFPFNIKADDNDEVILNKMKSGWRVENINNIFSKHFIDFLNGLLEIDMNRRMNINQALNSYFIKGAEIIINEKEKTYNANIFLTYLLTDHIIPFQEYISK